MKPSKAPAPLAAPKAPDLDLVGWTRANKKLPKPGRVVRALFLRFNAAVVVQAVHFPPDKLPQDWLPTKNGWYERVNYPDHEPQHFRIPFEVTHWCKL